jgi:hypothetical protein
MPIMMLVSKLPAPLGATCCLLPCRLFLCACYFPIRFPCRRWKKLFWLKTIGPAVVSAVGIITVKAAGINNQTPPSIRIVKKIPKGMPPVTIGDWAPLIDGPGILPLCFIVMIVDLLESTSIARCVMMSECL